MKKPKTKYYFLLSIILIYIILFFINKNLTIESLIFFKDILIKLIPVFIAVFILMTISNYFLTQKRITKFLGEKSGKKKWLYAITFGILSSGPVYMWYPLLKDLKQKGMQQGLIACFLYNRAIKIPLLPVILIYFDIQFVLILVSIMILASLIQGVIINKIVS